MSMFTIYSYNYIDSGLSFKPYPHVQQNKTKLENKAIEKQLKLETETLPRPP